MSSWSKSSLLRHVLLTASNRRVIMVASPFGFINRITVICHFTLSGRALGACNSELREAAAETALTAVVNSDIVAEVLLVLAGLVAALAACMS